MMLQASLVSTTAFVAAGGFDPRLPSREDTDLFFKLCIGQRVCAVARRSGDHHRGRHVGRAAHRVAREQQPILVGVVRAPLRSVRCRTRAWRRPTAGRSAPSSARRIGDWGVG